MTQRYIMESAREGERLAEKTDQATVAEELELTGLGPGARALDAGCASGAVTRAMAARVGPGGRVWGVDMSAERLGLARAQPLPQVDYLRADLSRLPLQDGSVDYAICRLVLEYLRDPQPVVDELARVVAPGGRLVLADVDGYGALHHPLEGARREAVDALSGLLAKTGFDAFVGRKLHGMLRRAGFQRVEVQVRGYHVVAGAIAPQARENWRYKLETLAPLGRKLLGERYDAHAREVLALFDDPDAFSYDVMVLAVGHKA